MDRGSWGRDGRPVRLAVVAAMAAWAASAGGCAIAALVGGMAEQHRRQSTHSVAAEYEGLVGHDFAVVVSADRAIQADFPELVPRLTTEITQRLSSYAGASGVVPADRLLAYLYENPRWVAMPRSELAAELGVSRLVLVELHEYRLNEPGNQYLWDGVAAGHVAVIEADSSVPEQYAFERSIRVGFPDKTGQGPNEFPAAVVATALVQRFADRAAWLFYEHEEPYYPDY